jgi:hypothetical protein
MIVSADISTAISLTFGLIANLIGTKASCGDVVPTSRDPQAEMGKVVWALSVECDREVLKFHTNNRETPSERAQAEMK